MPKFKVDGVEYDDPFVSSKVESGSAYAWAMTHQSTTGHNVSIEIMVHHAVCWTCKVVSYDQWAFLGEPKKPEPPPPPVVIQATQTLAGSNAADAPPPFAPPPSV